MPKMRYDVPFWHQQPASAPARAPMLRGELDADVVVIGGGLTGCLAACLLAAARRSVVLLEADALGSGSSSRASGLWWAQPSVSFSELRQASGLKAARAIFEAHRQAARELPRLLAKLGVRERPALVEGRWLALSDDQARTLRREHDAEEEAGLGPAWCPPKTVAKDMGLDVVAALRRSGPGVFHPHRLAGQLAAACARAKVRVFERTPAKKVAFHRSGVQVATPHGRVSASHVVVATGEPGALFKALRRHFAAHDVYVVATEPLAAPARRALAGGLGGRDGEQPPHAWALTSDHRLIIEGGEQPPPPAKARAATVVQRTGQLMYEISRLYPDISGTQPVAGWSCPVVTAKDGLPYVGPHRAFPHHVFALGLGRTGPAGALVAARVVVRHVLGAATTADEALGFHRG